MLGRNPEARLLIKIICITTGSIISALMHLIISLLVLHDTHIPRFFSAIHHYLTLLIHKSDLSGVDILVFSCI